jgi:hypothetical protein
MAVNRLTAYLLARERCALEVVNMVVAVEENVNIKKISYLISFALPTGIYRPFQNHPRIASDTDGKRRVEPVAGLPNPRKQSSCCVTFDDSFCFPYTMSTPPKIGGEYGEIRATIDINTLNAYLAKNTPSIKTPVDVKQFKVLIMIVFVKDIC